VEGVIGGEEGALDKYYRTLDIRNDDLRWVLTASRVSLRMRLLLMAAILTLLIAVIPMTKKNINIRFIS